MTLVEHGIAIKIIQTVTEIKYLSAIYRYKCQAHEQGYDPTVSQMMKIGWVADALHSGCPPKVTPQIEEAILANVRNDQNVRNKPCWVLGSEHQLSSSIILNVLHRNKIKPQKNTKKPSLTDVMMEARLQFCLRYQDWTLEDWKNVIWTDETSLMLNAKRGLKNRVWRTPNERYIRTCVRRRWKDYSESMFWGSFSYDEKGPFHI